MNLTCHDKDVASSGIVQLSSVVALYLSPGPGLSLTHSLGLIDCYKIDVLPELVVCEGSIAKMVKTRKEPSAVFRVHEESLARALVVLFGYGEYL